MAQATGAERYFANRQLEPEYADALQSAIRRTSSFDRVISDLNGQRESLGWSKAELARRSGLPPEAVRRIFSNQHKNPTLTTLIAIADALEARIIIQPPEKLVAIPSHSSSQPTAVSKHGPVHKKLVSVRPN